MPTVDGARFTDSYGTPRPNGPHAGIDIAGISPGTTPPIYAARTGTVQFVRDYYIPGRNGLHIGIRHSDGSLTFYGHVATPIVAEGEHVIRGQRIATMSNSGTSAIHLHFEWWTDAYNHNTNFNPIDRLAQNDWLFRNEGGQLRLYNEEEDFLSQAQYEAIMNRLNQIDARVEASDHNNQGRRDRIISEIEGLPGIVWGHQLPHPRQETTSSAGAYLASDYANGQEVLRRLPEN